MKEEIEGHIELEAVSKERGLFRFYHVRVYRDLFGNMCLMTRCGRKGTYGRKKEYLFEDEESLRKKLLKIVKKRLSAQSRIGINYEIIENSIEE